MGRGGRWCAMLLVAILLLVLPAGCASTPPPVTAPPKPKPSVQPWHLSVVASPSSTQQAEIAAFGRYLGQPRGGPLLLDFHWTRLAPSEVPAKLAPKDTLGRGLLVAYGTSARLTTPTPAEPVAALDLLFEGGLECHWNSVAGGSMMGGTPGDSRWAQEVAQWEGHPDKYESSVTSASVGSALALVTVTRGTRTHKAADTSVSWGVPPWTYFISLPGTDTASALRVARSVAR